MLTIDNLNLPNFPLLLAPMEDVSDPPFRAVCKDNGADIMYTEFISSEALIRDAAQSVAKLDIFEYERPIGIQIFGHDIEVMRESVEITERVQPDIIDINYGCPVKKVTCKGAGAGILQDIPKMVKMTAEMVKATTLPVTVKTRLGWDDNTKYIVEVAERLQDVGIKAIAIHGRTRRQMYKGEADWTLIGRIKDNPRMTIPVFGNGDVDSPQKAAKMRKKYAVDGIMIGRAAIGYPWIFNEIKHYFSTGELLSPPSIDERISVFRKHLDFSIQWKGLKLGLIEMRRHYSNYFKGIPHVKPFRSRLVTCESYDGVISIVEELRRHAYQFQNNFDQFLISKLHFENVLT
ncbi:MAG: tRNA dihydrouridine synthase DusB [Candidatus Poribacteria bacterium]|nr:tRNA dihydrouridine synthase DusB [Candidatus Poribacteria bacterium]